MDESKIPVMHCPTCYSTNFKISRVRPEDRLQMLIFKYPVRCRKCSARIYASRSYAKWLRKAEEARQAEKAAAR
ncbi:MAG TPA: hypothetical protein VGD62_03970 [Acidobacteriaceae bacterium]